MMPQRVRLQHEAAVRCPASVSTGSPFDKITVSAFKLRFSLGKEEAVCGEAVPSENHLWWCMTLKPQGLSLWRKDALFWGKTAPLAPLTLGLAYRHQGAVSMPCTHTEAPPVPRVHRPWDLILGVRWGLGLHFSQAPGYCGPAPCFRTSLAAGPS